MADRDWNDVEACRNGDDEAYARLVKRYEVEIAAQMWRFSRDPMVHRELVQDVFVESYYSLKGFRGDAPFLHWLRRIATRVGYRYWKKRSREPVKVPLEEWDGAQQPEVSMEATRAATILHALLARLPPKDRLVLTLIYFEDCSTSEIASRTGWSQGMVKMRAHRARKKLKAIAEQENLVEDLRWTS